MRKLDGMIQTELHENISNMLPKGDGAAGRPDATIANPEIESFFELSLIPASPYGGQDFANF